MKEYEGGNIAKDHFISITTIVTLLIIVFVEAAHGLLHDKAGLAFLQIMLGSAVLAIVLSIVLNHSRIIKRKYYQVARLGIILLIALSVEGFANYVTNDVSREVSRTYGVWIVTFTTLGIILALAWYGYVESRELKAF